MRELIERLGVVLDELFGYGGGWRNPSGKGKQVPRDSYSYGGPEREHSRDATMRAKKFAKGIIKDKKHYDLASSKKFVRLGKKHAKQHLAARSRLARMKRPGLWKKLHGEAMEALLASLEEGKGPRKVQYKSPGIQNTMDVLKVSLTPHKEPDFEVEPDEDGAEQRIVPRWYRDGLSRRGVFGKSF